jgi:TonB family protein
MPTNAVALTRLLLTERPSLMRLVQRIVGSGETAENVAQNLWFQVQHLRYPRAAMARRQQGVPYVRFVMDREGHVLSATLERSSGFPDLDREAVALPRRAQPLPKPPANTRPEQATIELVVPVEFFVAR